MSVFVTIRNEMIKENDSALVELTSSGDSYIRELNLPIMEIDTLNPILTTNVQVQNILKLIYEPLVSFEKSDMITSCLATEWSERDDLNWIVKLRKGVKWHNGTDFTADDVKFTILQIKDETLNSPYKDNLSNVTAVEKLDDYSVLITLDHKDNLFMYKLNFPIIPEYYFKNGDITNETKVNIPVGTGMYKYISTDENIISLERNKSWWSKSTISRLEKIYLHKYSTYGEAIKAYKSSEVDIIVTTMSDWEKKFGTIGNNVYRYESAVFDTIIPNTKKLALSDSSVRKAILYAINRENIVSKVFNSNASIVEMPIHSTSRFYSTDISSEYDLDKAKQILLNAGWKSSNGVWSKNISKTNCNLNFSLIVNKDNKEHVTASETIKECLQDLGIKINIKSLSWSEYKSALETGNFDLAMASFDIKNETSLIDMLDESSSNNYTRFTSREMSEVINSLKRTNSDEDMKKLIEIYRTEMPYIGLYFRDNILLTNKSVKGSIEPFWANPYNGILTWCK